MRSELRTFVRLTIGNWLSGSYLALAAFFLLFGFGVNGSYVAGLFAGLLALPTGVVLIAVVNSLGAWAQTGVAAVCILLFSYTFQAFLLGLFLRAVRRRSARSGRIAPASDSPATRSAPTAGGRTS
ncbi:hypothetical protein [Streptomyces sp. NPDC097981]|uniref:SCO4225 family membrane protein n=1 Tax=Streptomyces sp. NPDC097981 TaxID=3155428 RepID=UPI00333243F5